MKNEKKSSLSEEHLRKIKYRVGYKINESPKYRPLVGDNEEFDAVPDSNYMTREGQPVPPTSPMTNEAGDQEDAPKPEGQEPPAPSNDVPQNTDAPVEPPVPAFDKTGGNDQLSPENSAPVNPMGDDMGMGVPDPAQEVDVLQNDIIKSNIEALKNIHNQLASLNATVEALNAESKAMKADVEEVREPTNTEKLMSKKQVSYPYYFNLNDFWNGNWFTEERQKQQEKGINELPDGTYVADFDDLPQKSKIDVQNSFNQIS